MCVIGSRVEQHHIGRSKQARQIFIAGRPCCNSCCDLDAALVGIHNHVQPAIPQQICLAKRTRLDPDRISPRIGEQSACPCHGESLSHLDDPGWFVRFRCLGCGHGGHCAPLIFVAMASLDG